MFTLLLAVEGALSSTDEDLDLVSARLMEDRIRLPEGTDMT